MRMEFSIVIPTYNGKDRLWQCLKSILDQKYRKKFEIIVIDDGSVDGTDAFMRTVAEEHRNIRYYRIRHSGPGRARNRGILEARGRYIAFTDDDCSPEKDWLMKLEEAFARTGADAVGGTVLNPTDRYVAWSSHLLIFCTWFPYGKERFVNNIPTANIAYRKESIGSFRFNEELGTAGYEDSLFNLGLVKEGRRILFCPDIAVAHRSWDYRLDLRKFFSIQKRTARGFLLGGYAAHGSQGKILMRFKVLNLLCPNLLYVFLRCVRTGQTIRFLYHLPLMLAGEIYKATVIISSKNIAAME